MHHPIDWLKDRSNAEKYLSSRARVLIVGHQHVQQLQKVTTPNNEERLIIASGALTPPEETADYTYRFNILEFDTSLDGISPSLTVKVFPRVWSAGQTAFRADHDCLNGRDSATISLRCPMFDLPPGNGPAAETLAVEEHLCRLRYLFWRRLVWQARIRVLMDAQVLPPAPKAPLPHAMEEAALRNAESGAKLHTLWEMVMKQLPESDRELNPFVQPE